MEFRTASSFSKMLGLTDKGCIARKRKYRSNCKDSLLGHANTSHHTLLKSSSSWTNSKKVYSLQDKNTILTILQET